jgi:hypothetical protein
MTAESGREDENAASSIILIIFFRFGLVSLFIYSRRRSASVCVHHDGEAPASLDYVPRSRPLFYFFLALPTV